MGTTFDLTYNMKHITKYLIFSVILFTCLQGTVAQSKSVKKGDGYYKKGEYYHALVSYNYARTEGEELDSNTKKKIANCYYQLNDIQNAFEYFASVQDDLSGDDVLTYAMVAHRFAAYDMAIEWYELAKKEGANAMKVNELIESCKWALANNEFDEDYRVNPSSIFTFGQSFGIQFYKSGVVYSSSSSEGNTKKIDKQGKAFLNLYFSELVDYEIQKGSLFSKSLNFDYHIGAISFTTDYNTMYYTRSVRVKGGQSKLKIFRVEYDGKDWGNELELPFNSDDYDCAHPAVSPDNKFIYFTSNKKGGYGGKDLYKVERLRGGSYGKVINLGPEINTFGDEVFPFVAKDYTLYFSSDGRLGFGGLDLYKAEYEEGAWKNVANMLKPFNSERDDFGYVQNPQNKNKGFLSSNRTGNGDKDAIFYVNFIGQEESDEPKVGEEIVLEELPEEKVEVVVPVVVAPVIIENTLPASFNPTIKSSMGNVPVAGIQCEIVDDVTGQVVATGISNSNGKLALTIPDAYRKEGQEFEVVFSKDGDYVSKRMIVNIMELEDLSKNGVTLTPVFNDVVLDDLSEMVLYYKNGELTADSEKVLGRLAAYLNANPNIVVKLNTHTDAKGSKLDNLLNSQSMGEKVEGMLVDKGVNDDSMIPRGYGERYLVNECKRGVVCDESEHQKNRRVEVIVWKVNK